MEFVAGSSPDHGEERSAAQAEHLRDAEMAFGQRRKESGRVLSGGGIHKNQVLSELSRGLQTVLRTTKLSTFQDLLKSDVPRVRPGAGGRRQ